MGDTIRFPSSIGVIPIFADNGSRIERPDILPIFWGPNWPGSGAVTVVSVMKALRDLVAGSYFDGLKQYGYIGPCQVRDPRVDQGGGALTLPPAGPGVDQTVAIINAVNDYVKGLVADDAISNVDDNHEIIAIVFLDPSVIGPRIFDAFNKVILTPGGSNTRFEKFELFDDNTRFQLCWVVTSSGSLATVMAFASHELAESITDPFNGGWEQTFPPSSAFAGQIGDVCKQTGVSNGVGVSAYWSISDNACIIPTAGVRRVSLTKSEVAHEQHDGPGRSGFVDMGPLCGSGTFGYFERTFRNEIVVTAQIVGYESPKVAWVVDGKPVSILQGAINVVANWDPEPPPAAGAAAPPKPATAQLATTHLSPDSPEVRISVGPNAGNVSFRIDVSVVESFDTGDASGRKTSQRTALLEVDLHNQEIVWDARHGDAVKNCERVKHLFDGPGGVIGPHDPGDPANLLGQVEQVIERGRSEYLLTVARTLETARPELAKVLKSLARPRQG
jgi:hypothetical protein